MTKEDKALAKHKHEQAIKALNEDLSLLKIAPSDIHGVGVVATRDIKRGERLMASEMSQMFDLPYKKFNKLNKNVREEIEGHFPYVVDKSHFWYPPCPWIMFMNHSTKPNYSDKTDKAKRAIKKGEEVVQDYRKIENYEKVFKFIK